MDGRLRLRFLLALLSALLAWFVWAEQRRASDELAEALQAQTRSLRENTATARERERREHFFRVAERLAERAPPPKSAAAVREFFLQVAEDHGVELSASRLQPLVRPPEGTLGAEARITLLGDPAALSRFLASVEGRGVASPHRAGDARDPWRPRNAHRYGPRLVAGSGRFVHRGGRGSGG